MKSQITERVLAMSSFCITAIAVIGDFVVRGGPVIDVVAVGTATLVSAGVGSLIALRRPRNVCGWLLAAAAMLGQLGISTQSFAQARIQGGVEASATALGAAWVTSWLPLVPAILMVLLLLRFPTGALPSRRWRVVEIAAFAALVLAPTSTALSAGELDATPSLANPLGIQALTGPLSLMENLGQSLLAAAAVGAVASIFFRYRSSSTEERQQLKWVAYSVALLMLGVALAVTVETAGALNEASFFIALVGVTAIPLSIGIAMLRYRLFDIDLLISRTIVYSLMTAGVLGFYVAIVGTLTGVIGRRVNLGASLVATAVVAMAFNPIREGIQRQVNKLMFGQRDDPYAVVSGLGHMLERAATPETVLPTAARDIAGSLRLPYVGISLLDNGEERMAAEEGSGQGPKKEFPLLHHGEKVGALIVSPRRGEAALDERDQTLLTSLARHIGPAAHAVRLTEALRSSRAEIVRAREKERRRLRRDLHDGHGAQLAGIALGVSAAQDLLKQNISEAEDRLAKVDAQLREAIAGIRTIVAGLVPPELERLGLERALEERAGAVTVPGLRVTVRGKVTGEIGAATESAAYHIALEALTNVIHHADASNCTIDLFLGVDLRLEIADDGRGLAEDHRFGTGLSSMRERAEEIGGELALETHSQIGTTVTARLPLTP